MAIDIVVNLPKTGGKRHCLTIVDMFTRSDRSAESVADALYDAIIRVHGAPEMIRTDNERAFVGKLMTCLLNKWEIQPIMTRAYHSEANGHVERFHRYLNELLTIECGKKSWIDGVKSVCFTYNNGCHSSTGYTPYYLMHGRHPCLACRDSGGAG